MCFLDNLPSGSLEMRHIDGHTDNAIDLTVAEKKSLKTGDTHVDMNFQCKGNNLALRSSIILNFYIHVFAWCFKQCAKFSGIWLNSAYPLGGH